MLWPLLGLSAALLALLSLMMFLQWKTYQLREKNQSQLIQSLQDQNRDLLNRMMSADLPAYHTMTAASKTSSVGFDDPYYPQTDEAELNRLRHLYAQGQPVGEYIDPSDPEIEGFLDDFGAEVMRREGQ